VIVRVGGAPVDQGRAQGAALREPVRAALAGLRARHTAGSWLAARRRARAGPGRALERFLPWLGERLEGIALGARVGTAALQLGERMGVRGVAGAQAGEPCASLDVPAELEPQLVIRACVPDAGGFASIELTCAHWSGCLGGINSEGLGVLCSDDRPHSEPSLRFLVQELLFRARDPGAALEHLRRRARYAGGTGELLLAAPGAPVRRLQLDAGSVRELAPLARAPADFTLALDCARRELRFRPGSGEEQRGIAPETPAVAG
jgi:hypothetical protein